MRKFRAFIHGINFHIRNKDSEHIDLLGFYVIASVEAASSEAAEIAAVDLVRASSKVRDALLNPPDDPPRIFVEQIEEVATWPTDSKLPLGGFIFYNDPDADWRNEPRPPNVYPSAAVNSLSGRCALGVTQPSRVLSRSKLFNPSDYNLAANPSLPKTNSPWRLWGSLILAAIACFMAWHFLRGPIRVSRPAIEITGECVTATADATNDTSNPVSLNLRFVLGRTSPATDTAPAGFYQLAQRDIEVHIPPRSTERVRCEFSVPQRFTPLEAEVQVLRRP